MAAMHQRRAWLYSIVSTSVMKSVEEYTYLMFKKVVLKVA